MNILNLNKKFGFSLLELILAIAIFSLSSVALSTLLIDSNLNTQLNLERTEALLYAREGVEAVRSIRDGSWSELVSGNHGITNNGTSWVFTGLSDQIKDKYVRTIVITDVSTSTKNASVTVRWNLTSTRTANIILNTTLTNWRLL